MHEKNGTHNRLVIEDDGPGIKDEIRLRVFDRFFRARNAKQIEGSGLGLAISKWLADAQGLELTVIDATLGLGAAIQIDFPR